MVEIEVMEGDAIDMTIDVIDMMTEDEVEILIGGDLEAEHHRDIDETVAETDMVLVEGGLDLDHPLAIEEIPEIGMIIEEGDRLVLASFKEEEEGIRVIGELGRGLGVRLGGGKKCAQKIK